MNHEGKSQLLLLSYLKAEGNATHADLSRPAVAYLRRISYYLVSIICITRIWSFFETSGIFMMLCKKIFKYELSKKKTSKNQIFKTQTYERPFHVEFLTKFVEALYLPSSDLIFVELPELFLCNEKQKIGVLFDPLLHWLNVCQIKKGIQYFECKKQSYIFEAYFLPINWLEFISKQTASI